MNRIRLLSALTILCISGSMLTGCRSKSDPTPTAAEPEAKAEETADSGLPVMMHTRLQYRLSSKTSGDKLNAGSELRYALQLQTPLMRDGKGATATYRGADSGVDQVQGDVTASGQATLKDSDISTNETLNLAGHWPTLVVPEHGRFNAQPPERSLTGEGMALRLVLEAPMEGSQSATITNERGSMTTDVTLSRPLPCVLDSSSKQETCKIELSIDPAPTTAHDEGGKLMLPRIKEALAQPNGEWAMALLGQVYGATTEWRADGGFVLRFNRDYQLIKDGTTMTLEMKLLVWTAKPGDNSEPKPLS